MKITGYNQIFEKYTYRYSDLEFVCWIAMTVATNRYQLEKRRNGVRIAELRPQSPEGQTKG